MAYASSTPLSRPSGRSPATARAGTDIRGDYGHVAPRGTETWRKYIDMGLAHTTTSGSGGGGSGGVEATGASSGSQVVDALKGAASQYFQTRSGGWLIGSRLHCHARWALTVSRFVVGVGWRGAHRRWGAFERPHTAAHDSNATQGVGGRPTSPWCASNCLHSTQLQPVCGFQQPRVPVHIRIRDRDNWGPSAPDSPLAGAIAPPQRRRVAWEVVSRRRCGRHDQ